VTLVCPLVELERHPIASAVTTCAIDFTNAGTQSVGSVTLADVASPVVERWNGSRWTRVPLPADLGPAAITDVTTTTGGVALVGRQTIDQVPQPLAMVLDRTGWHEAPLTAAPSSQASLSSVTTDASGVMVGRRHPLGVHRVLRITRRQGLCACLTTPASRPIVVIARGRCVCPGSAAGAVGS
jgi:hypothetical protein